jgi:hypothetical protein
MIGIGAAAALINQLITQAETHAARITGTEIEASRARETASASTTRLIQDGDIVTASRTAPCGRTVAALDEAIKWAVRHDEREMFRTLVTTGSGILKAGDSVKVLNRQGFWDQKAKVRITRAGIEVECWVPIGALR